MTLHVLVPCGSLFMPKGGVLNTLASKSTGITTGLLHDLSYYSYSSSQERFTTANKQEKHRRDKVT